MKNKLKCLACALILMLLASCTATPQATNTPSAAPTAPAPSASAAAPAPSATVTPAQKFLQSKTNEELQTIAENLNLATLYTQYDVSDTRTLTSFGLFNFALSVSEPDLTSTYYDKSKSIYSVPKSFIKKVLDNYFDKYIFDVSRLNETAEYNEDLQLITFTAHGYTQNVFPEISGSKVISGNSILIYLSYFDRYDDPKSMSVIKKQLVTLTISPDASSYKYLSLKQEYTESYNDENSMNF